MNAALICVAASIFGIKVGWEPIAEGREEVEYIIQIEPQLLDSLRDGNYLLSNVPTELKVERYRIKVGTGWVPQEPSLEKIRADAKLEKTRDSAEEVAQDLPFRKASSGPEQPAPAETPEPIAAGGAAPVRDPALQTEPDAQPPPVPKRELFDRDPAERQHSFAAQGPPAARQFQWNQPAVGASSPANPPADPEPQPAGGTADRGRTRAGREFDDRASEKPLDATPIADNNPAADRVGGPHLRDPLFQAKPDEFKLETPSHVIPAAGEERYGTTNRADHRDDRKPPDKPTTNASAPKAAAGGAKHPGDEKTEPHASGWAIAFTSLLLVVSIAGNVSLGWIAWGERIRSRGLLEKLRAATATTRR
jgi:hypothetical protein